MAVFDCTYVNHDSTSVDLNGSDYKLLNPGPRGILQPMWRPKILRTPRKFPVGLYQESVSDQREIVVPLHIEGTSQSDLLANIVALWDALTVDCRDGVLGTFTYVTANGTERSIKCILGESADINDWLLAGENDAAHAKIDLPLTCPDPTFYDDTAVEPSGAFSGTSNVNISCANAGDADSYPTITITTGGVNTLENPSITDAYGNVLAFEETMAVSKVLVLTLSPQDLSMDYDSGTNWFEKRSKTSRLIVCKYGTNNLTFTADNAAANATIAISFYSRYSKHG